MSEDRSYLSLLQVQRLLAPINPNRVKVRDGMSHLEAYDIRRELNRIFGFGRWSSEVVESWLLYKERSWKVKSPSGWRPAAATDESAQERVDVGYRCRVRLTVHAPDGTVLAVHTEEACGDAGNFPISKRADAHDFAIKTAESQALKRCATAWGDQFGLSLYANGSRAAIVNWTLGPLGKEAHDAASEQGEASGPDTSDEYVPDETDPTVATPEAEQEDNRERSKPRKPNGKRPPAEPTAVIGADQAKAVSEAAAPAVTVDPPENPRQPPTEQSPEYLAAAKWAEVVAAREKDSRTRVQTILRVRTEAITAQLGEVRLPDGVTLKAALTKEFAEAKGER